MRVATVDTGTPIVTGVLRLAASWIGSECITFSDDLRPYLRIDGDTSLSIFYCTARDAFAGKSKGIARDGIS